MKTIFSFSRAAWGCALLAASLLPAGAQTNLLTNGSFELDANGKTFQSLNPSSAWRWFAVGDATGTATIRTAAATDGNVGMELVRGTGAGDSALDKDEAFLREPIAREKRVYQVLVDSKDGGQFGGSATLGLSLQFATAGPSLNFDPTAAWETYGFDALSDTSGTVSVRLSHPVESSSAYIDNVRLYDVTLGNRVTNGGFEHSATRPIGWRTYSLNPGEFTAVVTNTPADVYSGSNALRIERTFAGSGDNDAGADLFDNKIPVFPGERLKVTLVAKKVSGDANARLLVAVPQFDANGVYTSVQDLLFFEAGATYTTFTREVTLTPAAAAISLGLLVGDSSNADRHVGAYLIDNVSVQRVAATPPLLANGGFESQVNGDADGALKNWRTPFTGAGTVTARTTAATEGALGIEMAHGTGSPFWMDRWDRTTHVTLGSRPGVYQALIDAKDGGVHGGQDSFQLGLVLHDTPWPLYGTEIDPGANFETFGVTAPLLADRVGIDVRLTPSATENQSFLADNVRVTDVTHANRMINGGFENSTTRLVSWRTFSLNAGEFTATLDGDAVSGTHAARIERTVADGTSNDGGLDVDGNRVAVIPGELLSVRLQAKKLSGDTATRLCLVVSQYDSTGAWLGADLQYVFFLEPGSSYGSLGTLVRVAPNAQTVNIGLRVGDNAGADRHVGAYLVDDVQVTRATPAFTAAVLAYNNDSSVLKVTPSGWVDNGDVEAYTYQWKLNGVAIAGATRPTLARNEIPGAGTITCDVTSIGGSTLGNTITASLPASQASVFEAAQCNTIVVNGSADDWTTISSRVLPMSVFGQGGEDMEVAIQFAWNSTNLYCLVRELQDDNAQEAANLTAFQPTPYFFDSISFWFSFTNSSTLLNGECNPWFGFSSTGRTDLFTSRINNGDTFVQTMFTNGHVATSGTQAAHNRVIEASMSWADMAGVLNSNYQPVGGLVAAVGEGYTFGCEPLLVDNAAPAQAFRNGSTHTYPTGSDADSVDIKLVGANFSLNAAQHWVMFE